MESKANEQDEQFLNLFNSHMTLEDTPRPASQPPPQQHPYVVPNLPVNINPPKPISYASAHYTHTRHIQTTSSHTRSQFEIQNALLAAGIDPNQISPAQMSLLSTCPASEFNQLMQASRQQPEPPHMLAIPDLDIHDNDRRSTSTMDTEAEDGIIIPPQRPLSSPGILYVEPEPYMAAGYASFVPPEAGFCSVSRQRGLGDRGMRLAAIDPVYLGQELRNFGQAQEQVGNADEMEM